MQKKELWVVYFLWLFFGLLGVHKFYLNKFGMGLLYMCTGGIILVGWIIDLFTIPRQVREYNAMVDRMLQKT